MSQHKPFIEVIVCPYTQICTIPNLEPIDRKFSQCMVLDFEDGLWRIDDFMNYIWDNISDTALTSSERSALGERPSSLLSKAAKNLRISENDKDGGEIAEILLYAIMRHYYNALPVVPKIFYKQSVNMYANGADSVHIVLDDSDAGFSLWLGEAKFYDSIEDNRLNSIVQSVYNTLSTEKIKKENAIIVGVNELSTFDIPETTLLNITSLLNNETSIDKIKPLLHVPILLLHECDITARARAINEEYMANIENYYKYRINSYFKKQIAKCANSVYLYSKIYFHLIIVPVPQKSEIVERFIRRANIYRE